MHELQASEQGELFIAGCQLSQAAHRSAASGRSPPPPPPPPPPPAKSTRQALNGNRYLAVNDSKAAQGASQCAIKWCTAAEEAANGKCRVQPRRCPVQLAKQSACLSWPLRTTCLARILWKKLS